MINNLLGRIIVDMLENRDDKHGWNRGAFRDIIRLSPDQRGEVGERLLETLLNDIGVGGVTREGPLDRTLKHWDIRTDDMDVEVKTATLGRNSLSFQHESIERDRNYHALVFIDIAPNDIYMTWTAKNNIPWRELHRRANSNAYKWDTNLNRLIEGKNKVESPTDIRDSYNRLLAEIV